MTGTKAQYKSIQKEIKESSMQEVTKVSVNFAIRRNLREACLLVYRHLDGVMPMPPGISQNPSILISCKS